MLRHVRLRPFTARVRPHCRCSLGYTVASTDSSAPGGDQPNWIRAFLGSYEGYVAPCGADHLQGGASVLKGGQESGKGEKHELAAR